MSDTVNIEIHEQQTGKYITAAHNMEWENAIDLIKILPVGHHIELTVVDDPKCGLEIEIRKTSFSDGEARRYTVNLLNIESDEYDRWWDKMKQRLMA